MKYAPLLAALMLVLMSASVLAATTSNNAAPVFVTLLNYQPTPAQPGDILDVYVQLSNTQVASGGRSAEGVTVELIDSPVFQVEGQSTVSAGTIAPQGTYVARFRVRVNSGAGAGDRLITARVTQRGLSEQETDLTITVASDDSAVFITDVVTMPSVIQPGREADLQLELENLAGSRLRDVTIFLDLDGTPFVPIDGTARAKLQTLEQGRTGTVHFSLIAKPGATADVYEIPVDISFLDEQGTTVEKEDTIGLQINTPSNTKAYLDGVSRTADGKVELVIRLVNRGLSEVKFVEANIGTGNGFTVKDEDQEVYVGNIDSDDWETIRIHLDTDATEIELPLTYKYTDAFNTEFTVEQSFTIQVPEEIQDNSGITNIIVLLIVVGLVVFWIVRRRKKKRK